MLVLGRKVNERLIFEVAGRRIVVCLVQVRDNLGRTASHGKARIGIDAAADVRVYREEIAGKGKDAAL